MAGSFVGNVYDASKLLQVRRDLLADVLRPYGVPKRSPPPTPLDPASMRTQTRSGYSLPYGLPPPAVAAFTLPRGAFIPQGTKPAVVSRALAGLALDLTRAGVPVRATGNGGLYGLRGLGAVSADQITTQFVNPIIDTVTSQYCNDPNASWYVKLGCQTESTLHPIRAYLSRNLNLLDTYTPGTRAKVIAAIYQATWGQAPSQQFASQLAALPHNAVDSLIGDIADPRWRPGGPGASGASSGGTSGGSSRASDPNATVPGQPPLPDAQVAAVYGVAFGPNKIMTSDRAREFLALAPHYNSPAWMLHAMHNEKYLRTDGVFLGSLAVVNDPAGSAGQAFNAMILAGVSAPGGGPPAYTSTVPPYLPPGPADSSTLLLLGAAAVGLVLLVNSRSGASGRARAAPPPLSGVAHRRRRRRR